MKLFTRRTLASLILPLMAACNAKPVNSPPDKIVVVEGITDLPLPSSPAAPRYGDARDTSGIKWSSSDSSVVTVDARGRITGLQRGTTTIIARDAFYGSDSVVVEVAGAPSTTPPRTASDSVIAAMPERFWRVMAPKHITEGKTVVLRFAASPQPFPQGDTARMTIVDGRGRIPALPTVVAYRSRAGSLLANASPPSDGWHNDTLAREWKVTFDEHGHDSVDIYVQIMTTIDGGMGLFATMQVTLPVEVERSWLAPLHLFVGALASNLWTEVILGFIVLCACYRHRKRIHTMREQLPAWAQAWIPGPFFADAPARADSQLTILPPVTHVSPPAADCRHHDTSGVPCFCPAAMDARARESATNEGLVRDEIPEEVAHAGAASF